MTERERKLKRKIQLFVAGAMSVFFCLLLVLTVQLAIRGNQRAMERQLRATQTQLQQQIENEDMLEEYYLSQKFIEEYALKILGYGRDGAIFFES